MAINRLVYLIAGDTKALAESVEGAEDDVDDAVVQIEQRASLRQMWSLVLKDRGTHHSPVRSSQHQRAGRFDRRCEFESAGRLVAVAEQVSHRNRC